MKNYFIKPLALIVFLAIIYSCTREHSNFLDPNFNGSPDAPDSLSIRTNLEGNVLILWKDSGNDSGFEIWRKLTNNTLGNFGYVVLDAKTGNVLFEKYVFKIIILNYLILEKNV